MLSMLFGLVGMAMFMYGRKQVRLVPVAAGLALMIVPYFVPGPLLLGIVGVLLTALPFFVAL